MQLFVILFIWLFVVFVCLDGMFNIIMTWYYDYKNNKKLEQLKKDLKIK